MRGRIDPVWRLWGTRRGNRKHAKAFECTRNERYHVFFRLTVPIYNKKKSLMILPSLFGSLIDAPICRLLSSLTYLISSSIVLSAFPSVYVNASMRRLVDVLSGADRRWCSVSSNNNSKPSILCQLRAEVALGHLLFFTASCKWLMRTAFIFAVVRIVRSVILHAAFASLFVPVHSFPFSLPLIVLKSIADLQQQQHTAMTMQTLVPNSSKCIMSSTREYENKHEQPEKESRHTPKRNSLRIRYTTVGCVISNDNYVVSVPVRIRMCYVYMYLCIVGQWDG
ncbi:hypothetical protein DINM_002176 [Dirofilaria immitis]|nr:hypothetical protein [Dirofilaria immitis]